MAAAAAPAAEMAAAGSPAVADFLRPVLAPVASDCMQAAPAGAGLEVVGLQAEAGRSAAAGSAAADSLQVAVDCKRAALAAAGLAAAGLRAEAWSSAAADCKRAGLAAAGLAAAGLQAEVACSGAADSTRVAEDCSLLQVLPRAPTVTAMQPVPQNLHGTTQTPLSAQAYALWEL